jgi:hypothetical protein
MRTDKERLPGRVLAFQQRFDDKRDADWAVGMPFVPRSLLGSGVRAIRHRSRQLSNLITEESCPTQGRTIRTSSGRATSHCFELPCFVVFDEVAHWADDPNGRVESHPPERSERLTSRALFEKSTELHIGMGLPEGSRARLQAVSVKSRRRRPGNVVGAAEGAGQ